MRNPFSKPATPGQWLSHSICWAVACASLLWLLFEFSLEWYEHIRSVRIGGWIIFWLTYALIWQRAIIGGNHFVDLARTQAPGLRLGCALWLATLTVLQFAIMLLGITWTLLSF
ncbi:hypothetical protein [Hymenobacter cheonanensis]|uniref:hypothetical protein n=1 Tax=Hymenobacter sp. CA2-7 TaxID=3063993 RepID=UPI00271393F5|nr:hypothetical protein [Hymenobacter sp. CA2-7]MDO7884131.1 hypothetical protein [Hymenobacter sp. CA2-7]